jgi:hypothetical protein
VRIYSFTPPQNPNRKLWVAAAKPWPVGSIVLKSNPNHGQPDIRAAARPSDLSKGAGGGTAVETKTTRTRTCSEMSYNALLYQIDVCLAPFGPYTYSGLQYDHHYAMHLSVGQ